MRTGRIVTAGFIFALWTALHQPAAFAQVSTYHACGSGPASNEVYIYTDINYGGTCAGLYIGFYPLSGTGSGQFGLPNDSISSVKVGSGARARLFADNVYDGSYVALTAGNYASMPSGWNDATSSIRVENGSRSASCSDLAAGEFAVFRDFSEGSDCVVLHYGTTYPTPSDMGIANDNISSVDPGPAYDPCVPPDTGNYSGTLHADVSYSGASFSFSSGSSAQDLTSFNDETSSIDTLIICLH